VHIEPNATRRDVFSRTAMHTRRLGNDGPMLSVVGLGTWGFGGAGGFGFGPVDDHESIATIQHALDRGVNWIDTAAVYGLGHSEEVVGRAVRSRRIGEEVFIFTKCGQDWTQQPGTLIRDLRPMTIRRECEESLRRLQIERIDLYQFHWPDSATGTLVEDSWATMRDLVDGGKVRWGGVSNFGVDLLSRCAALGHIDSLQCPLNLINQTTREEIIPWCQAHGTGVIVYAPLASGLLSGAFTRERVGSLPSDDGRKRLPRFNEPQLSNTLMLVDRLKPLAHRMGLSLPALAVAWTLTVPGVTGAIAGARHPSQVDGWLPAGDLPVADETLGAIDRMVQTVSTQ
jgi:aryl-alcohol dehydrogenase-like predicted oxidoreductase